MKLLWRQQLKMWPHSKCDTDASCFNSFHFSNSYCHEKSYDKSYTRSYTFPLRSILVWSVKRSHGKVHYDKLSIIFLHLISNFSHGEESFIRCKYIYLFPRSQFKSIHRFELWICKFIHKHISVFVVILLKSWRMFS